MDWNERDLRRGRFSRRLVIDMTPEGQFAAPSPWASRFLRIAVLVAVILAAATLASLALWLALTLIPIAIVAGLIAYAAWRWQAWRAGRSSVDGDRDPFGP
jgi:hypothetical protein